MPPRPQPGMQTTATITAVYPIRGQRSRPHKTMRHLPRIAPSNMPQTTKSSADRHVRWLETSTKCSKHTVHQLCLTGRSQAENSRHSNKLTAKRQRLPDRGRSPRAPPRVHFRPPPSRPAKTTGTSRTPKRDIPRTQAVARHNERPQTIMALISRVPAPMLGTTNN